MELDFNTLLALAFTAWAGVVAFIGYGIRSDSRGVREDVRNVAKELKREVLRINDYILQTESRLSRLEEHLDASG